MVKKMLEKAQETKSAFSQRKTNTIGHHLHVELEKPSVGKQRVEWQLPGAVGGGVGELLFKGTNL